MRYHYAITDSQTVAARKHAADVYGQQKRQQKEVKRHERHVGARGGDVRLRRNTRSSAIKVLFNGLDLLVRLIEIWFYKPR